jgi:aspartyl protease family protein
MKTAALLACALLLLNPQAWAQTVGLAGMMGDKALLIVDGAPPKSVATGETYKGVKVLSVKGDAAEVDMGGKRLSLRVGEAPSNVGGAAAASGSHVILTAGSGGHFLTQGQINGNTVSFMVDTGATLVALSTTDADRMGLVYRNGQPVQTSTANGVIPAWRIKLNSVQIGDVLVYNVDAVVTQGSMPYVLLGNSYLSRFQMSRTNDQMMLERRY